MIFKCEVCASKVGLFSVRGNPVKVVFIISTKKGIFGKALSRFIFLWNFDTNLLR